MGLTQDILRPIGMYVVYHESSPNPVFFFLTQNLLFLMSTNEADIAREIQIFWVELTLSKICSRHFLYAAL